MKKTLLPSVFLLLSACASVNPNARDLVVMPVAYDYAEANAASAEMNAAWWQAFESPALDSLIVVALANNQDVAGGVARVRQSREQVRSAAAPLLPQGSATASASSNSDRGLEDISSSGRLSISYQLDLFGQNRASWRAAKASYVVQKFLQRALELTVQSDVAFNYFTILALRKQVDTARENLEISERIYEIVRIRYDAGNVSGFDVASQEVALANARARIVLLEQQLRSFESALAVLLGQPPQGFSAPPSVFLELNSPVVVSGMPSDLLRRRPDLLVAESSLNVAGANLDGARAAFFPSIDLGASISSASLTGGATALTTLSGALAQPIFNGGRLSANKKGAEARVDEAVAQYRQSVLLALREVDVALAGHQAASIRATNLEEALKASERSLSLSEIRYRAGSDGLTSLLNAQSTYFNASDSFIQGHLARLSASVDLFVALGGGWHE